MSDKEQITDLIDQLAGDKLDTVKEIINHVSPESIQNVVDGVDKIAEVIPEEHRNTIKEMISGFIGKFINKG